MSRVDAEGYVCRGEVLGGLSSETWNLKGYPVKSAEDCGFVIAWPDGVPFDHQHYVGAIDHPEQERAA